MKPPPGSSSFNPETGRYEASGCYWDGENWMAIDESPNAPETAPWWSRRWPLVAAGVGVLAIGIGIGALSAGGGDSGAAQAPSSTTRSIPTKTEVYNQAELDALQSTAVAAASSRTQASEQAQAQASAQQAARAAEENQRAIQAQQAAAEAQRSQFERSAYPAISERDYGLLVRDPNASQGRRLIVYGHVTQFDTITGATMFRAATAGVPGNAWYDFDINTIVNFDSITAANVVEGDIVTMYVEVVGKRDYTTTFGSTETAPVLKANIVDVSG